MTTDRQTAFQNFARHFATAISTVSLYSPEHHQVRRLCSLTLSDLEDAMEGRHDFSVVIIDNQMVVEGSPLEESLPVARLAQALTTRGIGHIRIMRGVTMDEILSVVESLSKKNSRGEVCSTANIRFGTVGVRFSYAAGETLTNDPDQPAHESACQVDMSKYGDMYEGIRKHKRLKVAGIMEIVSAFISTVKSEADPLLALAPLRSSDEYTFTHCANICILNLAQAMALGIDGPLLHDIGIAAMLHDVGKFLIPEEVLNKTGALDKEEWSLIQQHPVMGAQYLLDTPGVPHLAVITAFEHHMKYDFSGYPEVPDQWKQNLCSQMTTISDFFDALRTKRPYRGAMEREKISGIMLDISGTELHPLLARNFLKIMDSFHKPVDS
jgi:hypothetical protein